MLKSLALLPVKIARGIVSRIRRKPPQDEVRLPTRTDPDGPNRKPTPFDPAAVPPPAAKPAEKAAARPTPAEPAKATRPAPTADVTEPARATKPAAEAESPKTEAPKAEAEAEADAPKKGKKKAEPKKKKKDGEADAEAAPAEPAAEPAKKPGPKPKTAPLTVSGEPTPNPNAMKFQCSVQVVDKGSLSFNTAVAAKQNPLASAVFDVGGVRSVFAVKDFVTVTKEDGVDWSFLAPRIEAAIREHLAG